MVFGITAPSPASPASFSLVPSQPGVADASTRGLRNVTPAKSTESSAIRYAPIILVSSRTSTQWIVVGLPWRSPPHLTHPELTQG